MNLCPAKGKEKIMDISAKASRIVFLLDVVSSLPQKSFSLNYSLLPPILASLQQSCLARTSSTCANRHPVGEGNRLNFLY